jgi:putative transposase
MPRISRAVTVGLPHHIAQRGNYRQRVFERQDDYFRYIEWLIEYTRKYSLKVWAYCLMGNHVHYVAVPMEPDSLARTFNTLHMRYSQYVNRRHKTTGHLWQGRFFSCVLDEEHLSSGIRYVENNPVRANVAEKAEGYPWSSARSHVHRVVDPVVSSDCPLVESVADWPAYLDEKEDTRMTEAIRRNTKTGRPCGGEEFILWIEELIGRRVSAMARGRPRKLTQ